MLPRDAQAPEPASNPPQTRRNPSAAPGRPHVVPMSTSHGRSGSIIRPTALSSGPDLFGLLRALQRRWLLVLGLGVVLAPAAAIGAWLLLSARGTAIITIRISPLKPPPWSGSANPNESPSIFNRDLNTNITLITIPTVINLALADQKVKNLGFLQKEKDPAAYLQKELKVESHEGNEIVTVSLTGTAPDEQMIFLNALAKAFVDFVDKYEKDARASEQAKLEKDHAKQEEELQKKKERRNKLAKELKSTDPELQGRHYAGVIKENEEIVAQLKQNHSEQINVEHMLRLLEEQEKDFQTNGIPEAVLTAALYTDPLYKSHLEYLYKLKEKIRECSNSDPGQPGRTQLLAQQQYRIVKGWLESRRNEILGQLTRQHQNELHTKNKALTATLNTLDSNKKELKDQLAKSEEKIKGIGLSVQSTVEYEKVTEEIAREVPLADEIWKRIQLLESAQKSPPHITCLQDASLEMKDLKRPILGAVGAPVMILALICLCVAWMEFQTRRIRSADEVATGLGIPVVGAVPPLAGQRGNNSEGVIESIDALRTFLLQDANREATRVVMVTSASVGEGKTTLANSLADSLARAGRRTLLVDCDLRSPAAHQLFEAPLQPGFSEILLGEIDAADAIRPTPITSLWMIPAGQWDREVIQALAREGTQVIFEKLKEEFDFIIVDSHPVLAATDSLLLGQHVDAVLLSVLRDVSRSPRIYTACQRLSTLGIRILGAVVNGAAPDEVYANNQPHMAAAAVRA